MGIIGIVHILLCISKLLYCIIKILHTVYSLHVLCHILFKILETWYSQPPQYWAISPASFSDQFSAFSALAL